MPAVTVASTPDAPMRVRGDEGRVAGEQRDRDAHLGVGGAPADLGDHPADREARSPPRRRPPSTNSSAGVGEREAAGHDGGDRDAVGHQRGRVVEQPLALDRADHPPRHVEAPQDRRRPRAGRWARRSRPRTNAASHGMPGTSACAAHGDRAHRHQHEPDRAERDRAQVGPQVAEVGEDRRRVEQRREEDHQHDLGFERSPRAARG